MAQYEDSQYEESTAYAAASTRSRSPERQRSRSRDRRDRSKDRSSRRVPMEEDKRSRRHSPEARRRSRSRSYEERRNNSRREGGRSRSRSPRRERAAAPTGPRALQQQQSKGYYPPSSVHHPNHTPQSFPQRPSSPVNIQLAEYQVLLPSPGLIRFLIGPGGHRSRAVKAFSNVIRLTFAEENTVDGQVGTGVGLGKLRGSEDSIKRALECIRGLIEEEVNKENADGSRPKFDYGNWNEWASYDPSKIVWLGKSKEEYFEMKKGLGEENGGGNNGRKGFNRGAFEASGGAGGEWSTPGVQHQGGQSDRRPPSNDYRSDAGYIARPPAGQPTIVRNPNSGNPIGSIHLNSWQQQNGSSGIVSAMASVPHHAPGNQPHQQPFYISQQSYEEKDRREKEKGPYGFPDVVIPVPPAAVASLIGPKGAMIRDINSRSGAYCRIDRSGALPMLNIFGSGDVIERVMELIDEIIIKSDPTWTGGMNQPNQLSVGQGEQSQEQEQEQDSRRSMEAMEEVKMEDDGNYDRREYTEDEVDSILNSLPSGMLSKIIAKRLESNFR